MKRTTMYAIIEQGVADNAFNSVGCAGYSPIKDVLVECSKNIANEYAKTMKKGDLEDKIKYDVTSHGDFVTVTVNGYNNRRWTVVEINP